MTISRLPNAQLALIEERKITHYLLASDHPAGRAKAVFFERFEFRAAEWSRLHDALLDHACSARIISAADTEFGKKYVLEGTADDAGWSQAPRSNGLVCCDG